MLTPHAVHAVRHYNNCLIVIKEDLIDDIKAEHQGNESRIKRLSERVNSKIMTKSTIKAVWEALTISYYSNH